MSTLDLTGLAINISVGLFFLIITLILTLFSWRKWKYVQFDMLNSPAVRTWKDTLVEATIPIEFFQMIAISPYFESVQIAMEAISNIFMLDVIKVSQEDKSSY